MASASDVPRIYQDRKVETEFGYKTSPKSSYHVIMEDARGISRGPCKICLTCVRYNPPNSGLKCSQCGCPPAGHSRLDQSIQEQQEETSTVPLQSSDSVSEMIQSDLFACRAIGSLCGFPSCSQMADFDVNSGVENLYCHYHMTASDGMFVEDIELNDDQLEYKNDEGCSMFPESKIPKHDSLCIIPECFQPKYDEGGVVHDYCGKTHANEGNLRGILPNNQDEQVDALTTIMSPALVQVPSVPTCAIDECVNACYIDEAGAIHECCGITHAMEHKRRQALWQQVNQQVVKGITHCLLPNCDLHTWPFENYCGKTHATLGLQQGLVAPSPVAATGPKDSSLCIIPGCQKPKFVDSSSTGVTYDYCGKSHAEEGKRKGIYATANKVEDQCDLPGCANRKKTEGGTVYDYCCRDHAQKDAPNKDARILTSMPEVQKYLQTFPNLTVVSMKENDHAKPGGALFNNFKTAMMSLPSNQRNTCLAFHGTAENNIDSICSTGYDPKKRSGQACGPGEYFATSPSTPLGYCKGGKKLLLNELLLGQSGTHHTKHGDIVVMKNPDHDLPRFVITFK